MNTDNKRPQTDLDDSSTNADKDTIRHETIPGEKPAKEPTDKASRSTSDEDLN